MDVGKILSGSQLLQRSDSTQTIVSTISKTNAEDELDQFNNRNQLADEKVPSSDQVKVMSDALNKFLEPSKTSLKFEFHEKLEEYYVSIIDPTTKEVIKEIPPKKMLDIYAAMAEFIGIIVDKKI
ncbi:flagellar protein FlaG [Salirhabdus sp. Marseille-P4669]|uniref:flagellar protein FlaG n=1 Tax=Salirhabdus sp. Marseille-P4669 TaxID=2042310 RepID=UPI000C7B7DD2|nr:flagellar protein FlaG [Salirhabdus sp. Marseille-P4669]